MTRNTTEEHPSLHKAVLGAHKVVNAISAVFLTALFALGVWGLWDSHTVYDAASSSLWTPYKPEAASTESFGELQAINPDVIAWVEAYGTGIDYPVVKGDGTSFYLTHDAKREAAPSGALFTDEENSPHFNDFVTFIYGHHMDRSKMFGQLEDYRDLEYFNEHPYGTLYVDGKTWGVTFFCSLEADAYDFSIYKTAFANDEDRQTYLDVIKKRALCWREVNVTPQSHLVALSTCSTDTTNERIILFGIMTDEVHENTFAQQAKTGVGAGRDMWWVIVCLAIGLVITLAALVRLGIHAAHKRRKKQKKRDAKNVEDTSSALK